MLRGNLATRPFYNERLATLAVVLVGVVALLLTAYNATELVRLSSTRRDLRARIERDRSEATRIRSQAATRQQTVDRTMLTRLAEYTEEANDLIDQRTFSWTAFFGLIEKTLPPDVRLVMVSPRVEKGAFRVAMTVVAQDLSDVSTFVDSLLDTGKFYDAAPIDQQRRDDGSFNALIEASYLSAHSAPTPAAAAATSQPPSAPARPPR
jgi:hypothetical protein